jgi:hypothetical protein
MASEVLESSGLPIQSCPLCRGPVETGVVYGRFSAPRWSASPSVYTVFHGVPLVSSAFRRWLWPGLPPRPPSLVAVRCTVCQVGVFRYTNQATEEPNRAVVVAGTLVGLDLLLMVAVLALPLLSARFRAEAPPLVQGAVAAFLALFAVAAVVSFGLALRALLRWRQTGAGELTHAADAKTLGRFED